MGEIIKFPNPKDKNSDEKNSEKIPNYFHGIAVTGLVALFLFALVINLNLQNRKQKSRNIASIPDSSENSNLDQYILESLTASNKNLELIFAKKPTYEDRLVFGTLVGNYNIEKKNDRVISIHVKKGLKGLSTSKLPILLSQYKQTLGLKALKFKLISQSLEKNSNKLTYSLSVKDKKVGSLSLNVTPENKILGFTTEFQ